MAYILERVQTVPRPLDDVFPFFADPRNLARITPRWLAFRIVSTGELSMRRGLRIHYRIRPLGVPQRWVSVISVWEPPHRFVDEQVQGPYRYWRHEHTFRPLDGGTVIRDRVTYELPFGLLGRLVYRLLVRRQLEAIFDYRERQIRAILQ